MKRVSFSALLLCALATVASVVAQVPPPKDPEAVLSKSYTGKSYSPYAERGFPSRPFWGDTHLHTDISMDAGAFGNRLGLDDGYRFARGDEIVSTNGTPARLSRPLDFLVIADHSDNMGFFPALISGDPEMLADPTGRSWYDRIQQGGQAAVGVAVEIIQSLTQNTFPDALYLAPGTDGYRDAWEETVEAAEQFNDEAHRARVAEKELGQHPSPYRS